MALWPGSRPAVRYGIRGCAGVLALLCVGAPSAAQSPSGTDTAAASPCAVADDPSYAYTRERPVQVGGGAMFVASRQRRYMEALRGPAGETVRYKRTNSLQAPDGLTILDAYEVVYEGSGQPVTIYLDAYHFDDGMRAPKGFTCGAPIGLAPPGPDLFQASRFLARLAVEGAARDIPPIPLDLTVDGKPGRGIVLDHFRMMALVTRAGAAAGRPIVVDAATRPPDSLRQRTVVVAYPQSCDGRTIAPQTIDLASAHGQHAPRQGELASGEALRALLPGLDLPAGSLAATFGLQAPRPDDVVRITYAEACVADAALVLRQSPLRLVSAPEPVLAAGAAEGPGAIRVQAQADVDGVLKHVTYVGGPRELLDAAAQAVRGWLVEPVRINNAPISTPVVLLVKFVPTPGSDLELTLFSWSDPRGVRP